MRKLIKLEIGGKTLTLAPNFKAMAMIEEVEGQRTLFEIASEVWRGRPRLSLVVRIVFAGVTASGEKWSEEALGDFLMDNKFIKNDVFMSGVIEFLSDLLMAGSDTAEQKKTVEEQPLANISSKSLPENSISPPANSG